ncbi:MAG: response regulator [Symploca sp. SIO2B6]|nr:response regulator [Symploca sp. SIO2B6]
MTFSHNSSTPPKPKILVVDDEPDNLDLLFRTFRREFKVVKAESGPEALQLLEQQSDIAVIISDQRMPSMSGTEFLSLTATQYPDIIRIILTGYTDVEDLVEAINTGQVFKYVTKPWDEDELKGVVEQALNTHSVLRTRTRELRLNLRRETLVNEINSAIQGTLGSKEILRTLVATIGKNFEMDCCVLQPWQANGVESEVFTYVSSAMDGVLDEERCLALREPRVLAQTVWAIGDTEVIQGASNTPCGGDIEPGQSTYGCVPQQAWPSYQRLGIQSSLLVPFMYQSELLAVLALHSLQTPLIWQEEDIKLIAMVANQAALAFSQARTYEQVRTLAKQQALINTITTAIRSSLEPEAIFAAITQQLGEALQVDGCALSLWTANDTYVKCVGLYESHLVGEDITGSERIPSVERSPLPTSQVPISGNPVLKELLQTQAPVIIDDLTSHPEWNQFDLPLRQPARSLLIVPLLSDGEIIGSISLRQVHQPRHWPQDAIDLAQAVAVQAAIAVQQSDLYQTTRQMAEQLLELDQQKTKFFQNISHEFRTPLTLNIGPLETCVEQEQGLSYDQSVIALRNSRRLLRLVNQLLDLHRLDAGRMQPTFAPCSLKEFVYQVVEVFQEYCEKKGISLLTRLMESPPLYLDVEKFDKVLYNLLSNAMKFTSSGGSIQVTLESEGDRCILKVQDTGIGIREDQIGSLFDRFQQADGSTNRNYEGSGLGLALVKELVELHGGQVEVESVYGEGTTFTISLLYGSSHLPLDQVSDVPAEIGSTQSFVELADVATDVTEQDDIAMVDASMATIPDVAASVASSAPIGEENPKLTDESDQPKETAHLLIVDDNPDLRGYIASVLKQAGYQVSTARNGLEGLQVIQERRPNLVLTDLMMPQMSGLELIQHVRQNHEVKGTPIILVTAKADEDTRIEGTEKGADAYLSKPFNHRELLAAVRNLLALKASEQEVAKLNTYLTESVLKRFLPPPLVQKASQGELSLDLRPEPRLVTVLFSDIVGFTQISNTLRSRRVASLLNEYLAEMTSAVFENGGTVDKFMGDAVLAIFGAPEDLSPNEQVRRAIAAARQMLIKLKILNDKWQEQGIPSIQFRCGIHQGTAVVGMFGGEERSDYTAIGPSVNIASRIQEVAHPNGILVSATVADYLDDKEISKFEPLTLKGVDETVLTFALATDIDEG